MTLLELPDALTNPLLWLAGSCFLLAIALTALLVAALPTLLELARVSRSAEKLIDTLNRELPPTLEALRLTGTELSELTDEVSEGVQSASRTVQRVDRSFSTVQQQAQSVGRATRSAFVGFRAAWKTLTQPPQTSAPPPDATLPADLPAPAAEAAPGEAQPQERAIAPGTDHTHKRTGKDGGSVPLPPLDASPPPPDSEPAEPAIEPAADQDSVENLNSG